MNSHMDFIIERAHEEFPEFIGEETPKKELNTFLYYAAAIYYNPVYAKCNLDGGPESCFSCIEALEIIFEERDEIYAELLKKDYSFVKCLTEQYIGKFQSMFWFYFINDIRRVKEGEVFKQRGALPIFIATINQIANDEDLNEYKFERENDELVLKIIDKYGTGMYKCKKYPLAPITELPSQILTPVLCRP